MITIIGKWLASLNLIQTIGLWVSIACLVFIVLTYLFDWQRKRRTDNYKHKYNEKDDTKTKGK